MSDHIRMDRLLDRLALLLHPSFKFRSLHNYVRSENFATAP